MADLSICVWLSCSAYYTGGVLESLRESYIYGASDSAKVTAWSCLDVNRLPSATSTCTLRYLRTGVRRASILHVLID